MKPLFVPAFILGAATTAAAQDTDISAMIAEEGLASGEAALAAIVDPSPTEAFALGGVRFLGALETALQARYDVALSGGLVDRVDWPVLRLPIPPNPNAAPFEAHMIIDLFSQLERDLATALPPLDSINSSDDVALQINTGDIWFDINRNGLRDRGEDMMQIVGTALMTQRGDVPDMQNLTIQFDTADAAWLSAYAHLLSGVSETLMALDPTEAIDRVLAARTAFHEISPLPTDQRGWFSPADFADWLDLMAIHAFAMDQPVDVTHSRAAHAHFLGMIEDNKIFWARVAAETDNTSEWIPNSNQTSALPLPFPPDLGDRWQAVLQDAEALLNGELLLPFWRVGSDAGLNLAEMFQNPPQFEPVSVIHGEVLLPYVEYGPLVTRQNLIQFERLVVGRSGLFMIILN